MRPYDVQELGVGAYLVVIGLLAGGLGGAAMTEHRHEAQVRAEARAASAYARPDCAAVPAVDSRVAIGAPKGWVNVGFTAGCTDFRSVRLTLTDPRERGYDSVELGGYTGGNGAVLPLADDVPLGRWTARLDGADHSHLTTTEVRLASRVVRTSPSSVRVTVYDPATDGFRPWVTSLEVQHLTPVGWRTVERRTSAVDGTVRVGRPDGPGRYRAVTADTATVFGSTVARDAPTSKPPGLSALSR